MLIIKTAEYFCGGLTEAEKRQLFDEHVQWYRMYGMSMRPVPKTWEDFQEYWEAKCRDELEINRATLDIFTIRIPKPWFVLMPTPIWDQLFRPMVGAQRWIAAGLFDPAVREKAGMRWTPGDEVLLRIFGKLVELAFVAVPDEIRLHPRALAAYRRAQGRLLRRRSTGRGTRVHGTAPRPPWPADALRAAAQDAARPRGVAGAHHVLFGGAASTGPRPGESGKAA